MASLAGTVRWWEKVEEPTTVWQALLTDDGLEYYVNTETNETTWEKPEELMTTAELNARGDWVGRRTRLMYMCLQRVATRGKTQSAA